MNLDKPKPNNYVRIDKDDHGHPRTEFSVKQDEATVFDNLPAAAVWIEILQKLKFDLRIEGT